MPRAQLFGIEVAKARARVNHPVLSRREAATTWTRVGNIVLNQGGRGTDDVAPRFTYLLRHEHLAQEAEPRWLTWHPCQAALE